MNEQKLLLIATVLLVGSFAGLHYVMQNAANFFTLSGFCILLFWFLVRYELWKLKRQHLSVWAEQQEDLQRKLETSEEIEKLKGWFNLPSYKED